MRNSFLLSLATLTVVLGGLSASAEALESTDIDVETTVAAAPTDVQSSEASATESQLDFKATPTQIQVFNPEPVELENSNPVNLETQPIPGMFLTSAAALSEKTAETEASAVAQTGTMQQQTAPDPTLQQPTTPDPTLQQPTTPDPTLQQQTTPDPTIQRQTTPPADSPRQNELAPGRATRSGPSYIGIAGNIGLGEGGTAVGDGSFVVISKIGLTRIVSVRPSIFIDDDPTLLIPVTYDLVPRTVAPIPGRLPIAPYVGAGAALSFGDDTAVDLLLTGGIDVPLTPQFTATAAINATLFDNTAIGLLIGIAYNFPGF